MTDPDRDPSTSTPSEDLPLQLLHAQLITPPSPWLQITGSYSSISKPSNEKVEVIDFDIKAKAWSPSLVRLASNVSGSEEMQLQDLDDDEGSKDATGNDDVRRWLGSVGVDEVLIERVVIVDESLVSKRLQQRAKEVAYAGRVGVSFHDTSSTETLSSDDFDSGIEGQPKEDEADKHIGVPSSFKPPGHSPTHVSAKLDQLTGTRWVEDEEDQKWSGRVALHMRWSMEWLDGWMGMMCGKLGLRFLRC
ncbi:hypothetical protein DL98DRAFT_572295 [Cadophora sp. DSE1049]|nr:hypothetical protein DL98DRAFT_572295 [Cadophora sp. DSE1049]